MAELEGRERERTGIKTLKVGYNRVFGYYIEVSKAHADKVPPEWQRKQTLVGGERYTTEELRNHEYMDHKIVTSLCPGGKERMRRLMNVIASGRIDLEPLITHRFGLEQIEEAYELFANQKDGVLKVAITP